MVKPSFHHLNFLCPLSFPGTLTEIQKAGEEEENSTRIRVTFGGSIGQHMTLSIVLSYKFDYGVRTFIDLVSILTNLNFESR
jgi:hypothetical protein